NRSGKNTQEDYKTRLGVAVALKLMRQPIQLDKVDAYWVVSLLGSKDNDTRYAAADFMMNLESGSSVRNCFDELEKIFYAGVESPKDSGNSVINAAIIVGTWARVITPVNPSREPGTPFPQFALATAEKWKTRLES